MTFEEAKRVFLRGIINMTFEEAKRVFLNGDNKWREACYVISQCLKQEQCKDVVISRQAVFAAMRKNHRSGGRDIYGDYVEGNYREHLYDDIVSIPPAKPQEPCGDTVNIQVVLDVISKIGLSKSDTKEVQAVAECLKAVEALSHTTSEKEIHNEQTKS